MSQEEIFKILVELGGKATSKQIKQRALEKFPDFSLHSYAYNRLAKLEKNGYVKRLYEGEKIFWVVVAEYP